MKVQLQRDSIKKENRDKDREIINMLFWKKSSKKRKNWWGETEIRFKKNNYKDNQMVLLKYKLKKFRIRCL